MNTQAAQLRRLLRTGDFIVAPGVHDAYSARIVESAGFASACTSGAVLSQTLLGVPDLGLLSITENVDHCRRLARMVNIPVTADADAGYGNPFNAHHAIRLFEEAGLAGVNLEDQVTPRRWGATEPGEVAPIEEMVRKIEAACAARRDDDFVIIARTDALAPLGLAETLKRIKAYVAAGADVVLPMGARSEDQIARIVESAGRAPVSISVGVSWRIGTASLGASLQKLRALGVRRVSVPQLLAAASAKAMEHAARAIVEVIGDGDGTNSDLPDGLFASTAELQALANAYGAVELEQHLLRPHGKSEVAVTAQ